MIALFLISCIYVELKFLIWDKHATAINQLQIAMSIKTEPTNPI